MKTLEQGVPGLYRKLLNAAYQEYVAHVSNDTSSSSSDLKRALHDQYVFIDGANWMYHQIKKHVTHP